MACLPVSATLSHWLREAHGRFGPGAGAVIVGVIGSSTAFQSSAAVAIGHLSPLQSETIKAHIHPVLGQA